MVILDDLRGSSFFALVGLREGQALLLSDEDRGCDKSIWRECAR